MAKIIIVQTAKPAFDACATALEKGGFVSGTDFLLVRNIDDAQKAIDANEDQLLITGTLHGNEEEARSFVREMKKESPKLTAAIFSADKTGGEPFDFFIKKTQIDDVTQLFAEMKKFLGK